MDLQPPLLSLAPPLPPSSLEFNDIGRAFYHLQQQQQIHHQQELRIGSSASSLASLGGVALNQHDTSRLNSFGPFMGHTIPDSQHHNLSDSMLHLNLGSNNERRVFKGTEAWSDPNVSTASLRDQMNAQMAALYQHPKPEPCDQSRHAQSSERHSSNLQTSHVLNRQVKQLSKPSTESPSTVLNRHQLAPSMSPTRRSQSRSSTPLRTHSSSSHSSQLYHEKNNSLQSNAIVVSPEVTKPNDNIKVQVALLAEECHGRRVLLVGLFRLGHPTNEKPIFVKQVLFENKLHRSYRCLNTRITFRAPRSPGEFEFRVFEDKSSHGTTPKRPNQASDDQSSKVVYSNATIARSNKLKVCLEYSHFIDTLRATHDKLKQGIAEGNAGVVLSALLALMRLVDQVETVFLHGHALLGDVVHVCLGLLARPAADIAQCFAPTDTIPHPIETFHGTLCNLLNAIEANKCVMELVADEQVVDMARMQRERFCQVSGLYFANETDRCGYWLKHFGFAPIKSEPSGLNCEKDDLRHDSSRFVTHALTRWVEREATKLIPDRAAFRASRQSIYDQVHAEVIAKLPFPCDLDVFGSSANEFGSEHSDMDMCLVVPKDASPSVDDKQRMLLEVVARLEARPDLFTSIDTTRLTARIPIVMFVSRASGIECDLCVENRLAQRNTSLLRVYASADPRVRMLAYVLKRFVKQRRMNCAAEGTLSSYGYLLLLIHFLQRQTPPVLPVLQALPLTWPENSHNSLPNVFCRGPSDEQNASAVNPQGIETYFYDPFAFHDPKEKLTLLRDYCARNTQTVGELLMGFFRYYGLHFDATRDVVSICRPDAGTVTKDEKRRTCQWRLTTRLSIEDPFERSYNVAHVLKGSRDKYIRQQFARAYVLLMEGAIQNQREANLSDDDAVERIMSSLIEHVVDVPFLSTTASPPSPVPMLVPHHISHSRS